MGIFSKLRFASQAATAEKKGWSQPPSWSTEYPINRLAAWGAAPSGGQEQIEANFEAYVEQGLKRSGPVFAIISARQMLLSEARFIWRKYEDGRPTEPFTDDALKLLERPWPSGTTGDLIARMEQDASLAGNFFATTVDDNGVYGKASKGGPNRRIVRMRPDWVTILIGCKREDASPLDLDATVIGYLYRPNQVGYDDRQAPQHVLLTAEEVCHYTPDPDPVARFRGMSWLTPVVREIQADIASTEHKERFFENAAVPNLAVKFDKDTSEDAFDEFVESFKSSHQGAWNAYKTLFLMGGADVTPLTYDMRQLDFTNTVGKGESRLASAGGVPSAWLGFSEGMQGSSLNAGNLNSLRRRLADGTIRPLWRKMSSALQVLLDVPEGAHLWYDERDVAALREDMKDLAEIMQVSINGIEAGIRGGFDPDALVEAYRDYDVTKLIGKHSGRFSVQLLPPGAEFGEAGIRPDGGPGGEGKPPADDEKKPPADKPKPKGTEGQR